MRRKEEGVASAPAGHPPPLPLPTPSSCNEGEEYEMKPKLSKRTPVAARAMVALSCWNSCIPELNSLKSDDANILLKAR